MTDIEDPDNTFLIGDPHFDHTNIIKYCDRPFKSTEEMNSLILTNWNNTIGKDDLTFFLGDMAFGRDSRKPRWWLEKVNGRIIYFKGSHDKGIRPTSEGLNALEVVIHKVIHIDGTDLFLIHSPYEVPYIYNWRGWVVHGHVHHKRPFLDRNLRRINVSVEAINYKPISLTQILEAIKEDNG